MKWEENDAHSRRTTAPPTSHFSICLCLHFYYLISGESLFLHPNSVENNLERMVKNMVVVQTGCECEQGGGETCLLEM